MWYFSVDFRLHLLQKVFSFTKADFSVLTNCLGVKREGASALERSPEAKKPRLTQPNTTSPSSPASPPKPNSGTPSNDNSSKLHAVPPKQPPSLTTQQQLNLQAATVAIRQRLNQVKAMLARKGAELKANTLLDPAKQREQIAKLVAEHKNLELQLSRVEAVRSLR